MEKFMGIYATAHSECATSNTCCIRLGGGMSAIPKPASKPAPRLGTWIRELLLKERGTTEPRLSPLGGAVVCGVKTHRKESR